MQGREELRRAQVGDVRAGPRSSHKDVEGDQLADGLPDGAPGDSKLRRQLSLRWQTLARSKLARDDQLADQAGGIGRTRLGGGRQNLTSPPSISTDSPVMNAASSVARYATSPAISCGVPERSSAAS